MFYMALNVVHSFFCMFYMVQEFHKSKLRSEMIIGFFIHWLSRWCSGSKNIAGVLKLTIQPARLLTLLLVFIDLLTSRIQLCLKVLTDLKMLWTRACEWIKMFYPTEMSTDMFSSVLVAAVFLLILRAFWWKSFECMKLSYTLVLNHCPEPSATFKGVYMLAYINRLDG